jgi:hypothetical protein
MRDRLKQLANIASAVSGISGGALLFAKRISSFFDLVGLPTQLGAALVTIAAFAPWAIYCLLGVGAFGILFRIYDIFIPAQVPISSAPRRSIVTPVEGGSALVDGF